MTNELLKLVANSPAGVTAVGSGDLLGIVVELIRCVQAVAALVGVFAIIMMIKSLMPTKHERDLSTADDNQNNGQNYQPKRESLHFGCRIRLLLGKYGVQPSRLNRDNLLDVDMVKPIKLNARMKLAKRIKNVLDFLFHKKRTMPNVES
jgi:hypothetical protein